VHAKSFAVLPEQQSDGFVQLKTALVEKLKAG
jgi:hypothetical protein